MFEMLREVVVFCSVLGIAAAALGLAKLEPKPEKYKDIEGCYIEDLDIVIPFGEARPATKHCMEYRCGREWVQLASCGVVVVTPPQELVVHSELPYPNCCPMLKQDDIKSKDTVAETTNKL